MTTASEGGLVAALRAQLTPKWTKYIPFTPTPTQRAFLLRNDLEVGFGGAAGPGKSVALLMGALQYVDVPGYSAILFRRTYADLALPNALIDMSKQWLTSTDATWNEREKVWTFPTGAKLAFGYLENESDKYRYQGAAFQYCVAEGTAVRLADGRTAAIETLKPGDMVETLEGPRRVVRVQPPRLDRCVRAAVYAADGTLIGEQVQSADHPVLTRAGWRSYADMAVASHLCASCSPTQCPLGQRCASPSSSQSRSDWQSPGSPPSGPARVHGLTRPRPGHQSSSASCVGAGQAIRESGSAACGNARSEMRRHRGLSVPVVLRAPCPQSDAPSASPPDRACGVPGARALTSQADYPGRYSEGHGRGDGHARRGEAVAQSHLQRQGDVAPHSPSDLPAGDVGPIPTHTCRTGLYVHPYTRDIRQTCLPVCDATLVLTPCAPRRVIDMTVDGASHYITKTGLVNQNCGMDELTQLRESDYLYLFSRLRRRRDMPVPIRMRWASNPGGTGHQWVKQRFLVEGASADPPRMFIPARLRDNPYIDVEEYRQSLRLMPEIERRQLEDGDWSAVSAGSKFRRDWFDVIEHLPAHPNGWRYVQAEELRRVRFWDVAATSPKKASDDPDWSVGTLMGIYDGHYYLLDQVRFRDTPDGTEQRIKQVAQRDGRRVPVWFEQEPGAQAKLYIALLARRVLPEYEVHPYPTAGTGKKEMRANHYAAAAEQGRVKVLRAPWLSAFLDEHEAFPYGSHDDQVDSAAGAFEVLTVRKPVDRAAVWKLGVR